MSYLDEKIPCGPASTMGESIDAPPSYSQPSAQDPASSSSTTPAFRSHFACITLNMMDRIRLINFPPQYIDVTRRAILDNWSLGIQEERPYGRSAEFKLRGTPWIFRLHGSDDSRRLILGILEALYDSGWILQAAVDLSKKDQDKDSLIFRYQEPPLPACDWLSISFDAWSKIKIVGRVPPELAGALVQSLGPEVLQHESTPTRVKIKLQGNAWLPVGEKTVSLRILVLGMFQTLEEFGYSVYASIDQENGPDSIETDVLVVQRRKDWQPGMPICHR